MMNDLATTLKDILCIFSSLHFFFTYKKMVLEFDLSFNSVGLSPQESLSMA